LNSSKNQKEVLSDNTFSCFGLIAGNGRFPLLFARAAWKKGVKVLAIAHKGQTLPDLERYVSKIHWIKIGQLGKLIKILKAEKIKDAAMVGGITKSLMFSEVAPDFQAISLLAKLKTLNDDVLLRAISEKIEEEGIVIHSSTLFLSELLSPPGCLTKRKPNKKETNDIKFGWKVAKEIGRLDIGQSVVIKNKVILAVEAIEGNNYYHARGRRRCLSY